MVRTGKGWKPPNRTDRIREPRPVLFRGCESPEGSQLTGIAPSKENSLSIPVLDNVEVL